MPASRRKASSSSRTVIRLTKIKIGLTIVSIVVGLLAAAPLYSHINEYFLTAPRIEVLEKGDIAIWSESSDPHRASSLTMTVFVSSDHDFRLTVNSTVFRLDPAAYGYLSPDYLSTANVHVSWTTCNSSSRTMYLTLPVSTYFWVSPHSIVWEKLFPIGWLTIEVTVTDLKNDLTDSESFEVEVWWKSPESIIP